MARPRDDGTPPRPTDRRKFTDKLIKGLRPAERPYLVWDSIQRGFAITVHPSGSKTYRVIYSFRRRPRWYTISATNAISLAEARKLAGKVMTQVVNGLDPQAEKKASR